MELEDKCACTGLSSGSNPGSQLYTSANYNCKVWIKRPSFKKFKEYLKRIKVKETLC
jgi:hypothetical protein